MILHFLGLFYTDLEAPTLHSECVALQPHLAPPTSPNHLYVCHAIRLSFTTSVCCATSLSIILPAPSVWPLTRPHVELSVHHPDTSVCHTTHQSVHPSTNQSVALSIHTTASPSINPVRPSHDPSVHHPVNSSMTCQSVTPPISPAICPSDCPTSSDHSSTI